MIDNQEKQKEKKGKISLFGYEIKLNFFDKEGKEEK